MSTIYTELIFEPEILTSYSDENILWKAQVNLPKNFKSIISVLIQDNIYLNNRRPYQNWIDFLNTNNIEHKIDFDSEYCKSIKIYDDYIDFDFELFACDIKAGNYKIEVGMSDAMAILCILDLKKEGIINPVLLEKKVDNARQIIRANSDQMGSAEKSVLKYFLQINKLIEHCQFYEHDIKYYLKNR